MASLADLLRDPQFRQDVGNNARDFLQSASNTAASNVTAPVDGLAWLLRKAGVPVPQAPIGGSDWANNAGLMAEPKNKNSLASLLGEAAGNIAPIAGYAKAPEIAGGLNQLIKNANAPDTLNKGWHGQRGAIVWHGSPHKFDAFDASKIGTGEGAQAYGRGLYLADSPDVAKGYSLMADQNPTAQQYLKMWGGDRVKAEVAFMKDVHEGAFGKYTAQIAKDGDVLASIRGRGQIYKVDLPDSAIAKMLDWDKPLSQQASEVQAAAQKLGYPIDRTGGNFQRWASSPSGGLSINLRGPKDQGGLEKQAADVLRQTGIPGIRYLDGSSRAAGAGSSNYVIFPGNESLLKILSRNGQNLP